MTFSPAQSTIIANISHWTAFEVFLRDTVYGLIRRHPFKLSAMAKNRQGVSYDDIVSLTASFTSVDGLRDALIEREIEQQQAGGSSVHGLINFLKREMHFSSDPYSAWYSIDGSRRSASFQDLMELKDVRNSLIHDAGRPAAAFFKKYPGVPRSGAHIRINADYYRRFRLVLVSIAHSIAHSISTGAYNPEGWANGSERAATD